MRLTQYWHAPPPPEVATLVASQVAANPDLDHRLFDHAGAADFMAQRLGARAAQGFAECAVPAMQADLFRYGVLLADGGFWVDADTRGLAPLSSLLPSDAQGVVFERGNHNVINGCIGFRAPGHPLPALLLEIALEGIERRISESVWVATGPGILTYLLLLTRLDAHDRATLDFDHIGADVTRSVRLCAEVALRRFPDLDGLFAGVAVRPFDDFEAVAPEVAMAYKAGPLHWVDWQGSIFRSQRGAGTG
jgi:mannosyltransferase OCH1-like enzyme